MEYTEEQKQVFRSTFAIRRRRQLMISGSIIILTVFLITANERTGLILGAIPTLIFAPAALVALVGSLVFSFKNWRCPACNKCLGKAFIPHFCSKCGVGLR